MLVDGDLGTALPGRTAPSGGHGEWRGPRLFLRPHPPADVGVHWHGGPRAASCLTAQKVQDANWALPANGARDWGTIAGRGFRLPIPGVDGVPARAYLSILIVFSLLIGPANYWFLWRKRQQVLLVLTAPLISALFIVLLAGYVVAGEGLGVRGRAATFTMLDQARQQAVHARQHVAVRRRHDARPAGCASRGTSAVFPIGPDGTGSRDAHGPRSHRRAALLRRA